MTDTAFKTFTEDGGALTSILMGIIRGNMGVVSVYSDWTAEEISFLKLTNETVKFKRDGFNVTMYENGIKINGYKGRTFLGYLDFQAKKIKYKIIQRKRTVIF